MMLHNEFCAVWLSLSDVRTLLINIHIEQVPAIVLQFIVDRFAFVDY